MDVVTYILAKKYIDSKIGSIETSTSTLEKQVFDTLPEVGQEGIIYLVPVGDSKYAEYLWKDGSFVKLRETEVNSIVNQGYFLDGVFYDDPEHTIKSTININNIYVDKNSGKLFYYDTTKKCYEEILDEASATSAGVVKMYDSDGANTDGTMSQKAITDAINTKVKSAIDNLILIDGGGAN